MKIVIVNTNYWNSFPCDGGAGTESTVENLCIGLKKRNIDFSVIIPQRTIKRDYGFELIETKSRPERLESPNNFVNEVIDIINTRKSEFDIIMAHGHWSNAFIVSGLPLLTCIHCGFNKRPDNFIFNHPNQFYRFVSKYQYDVFIKEDWEKQRSFYAFTGMNDDEFIFNECKEDYYLWCSSLFWGFENKGMDDFIKLAQLNPNKNFIAYGVGSQNILDYLNIVSMKLSNFKWMGRLEQGNEHKRVFGNAKAFILTSKLPESLNRAAMEALCRGTVVLGYNVGSVSEEVQKHHGTYNNYFVLNKHLNDFFDYKASYEYARNTFHINNEIDQILRHSESIVKYGKLYN
ncbi:MAG: glycosyltransferase [Nanoarchaeota archaeon]